jgi:hypothetical protein
MPFYANICVERILRPVLVDVFFVYFFLRISDGKQTERMENRRIYVKKMIDDKNQFSGLVRKTCKKNQSWFLAVRV